MHIVVGSTGTVRGALAGIVLILAGCAGGEDVTARSIAEARRRWDRAAIRNYDLEWSSTGASRSHYVVAVRGGRVRSIEAILPGGKRMARHPPEPRYFGVEGLFMTIEQELALLRTDAPFGQPKGTKAVLRFSPDPALGYPRRYRRDVLGTPQSLAIDVLRFQPDPPPPAAAPGRDAP